MEPELAGFDPKTFPEAEDEAKTPDEPPKTDFCTTDEDETSKTRDAKSEKSCLR